LKELIKWNENYLRPCGLELPESLPFETWLEYVEKIKLINKFSLWWLGDLLYFGDRKYGEMYSQVLDEFDYEYGTLRIAKFVCGEIELLRRHNNLSFAMHQEVASLEPEIQDKLLRKAEENHLTRRELRAEVRKTKYQIQKVELPDGKYNVIYADPPWEYGNEMPSYFTEQDDYYSSMSIEQLCNLPIKKISADNTILFLWVTSPILEESFEVINAWGFKYKTSFVWDKVKHNMGHYNSVRHEFLLVCMKGSYQPEINKLFDSVQTIERNGHSEKPEEFRKIIETLYPSGKKIELFATKKIKNWESYGNQLSQ